MNFKTCIEKIMLCFSKYRKLFQYSFLYYDSMKLKSRNSRKRPIEIAKWPYFTGSVTENCPGRINEAILQEGGKKDEKEPIQQQQHQARGIPTPKRKTEVNFYFYDCIEIRGKLYFLRWNLIFEIYENHRSTVRIFKDLMILQHFVGI